IQRGGAALPCLCRQLGDEPSDHDRDDVRLERRLDALTCAVLVGKERRTIVETEAGLRRRCPSESADETRLLWQNDAIYISQGTADAGEKALKDTWTSPFPALHDVRLAHSIASERRQADAQRSAGQVLPFREPWDTVNDTGPFCLVDGKLVVGVE